MRPSPARVVLYGPRPEASHRTGGVAKWIEYLEEICRTADLRSRSLYIDRAAVERLPIPAVVKRGIGSCACALNVLGSSSLGSVVVHVNTSLYPTTVLRDWPIVAASAARGFQVFLQVHGGRLVNLDPGSISHRVWHWMCRRATALGIHPGPQLREFLAEGYGHKLHEMYNVVPETEGTAQLRNSTAHFLHLGRLTEDKGVMQVLENVLRLRNEGHRDVEMTIAGDGPLLQEIRGRVAASRHTAAISVEGFVDGQELERVRRRANVFVLASRHQEGFPFSFLECAERGMACVVTKNSAIPEVFEPGVEFEPVDLSDPTDLYLGMRRMVVDVDYRERIGLAAQEAVRSCCTIPAAGNRFRVLYRSLLEDTGRDSE